MSDDALSDFARETFEAALATDEIAPLFMKRPFYSVGTLGQWVWTEDKQFDIEHHVDHQERVDADFLLRGAS